MKTKENNILMADFLEWKKHETFNYLTPFFQDYLSIGDGICQTPIFRDDDLRFHESWDWLVPVLQKILEVTFNDEGDETAHSDHYYEIIDKFPDIEETHEAAVEFIVKYNNSTICSIDDRSPKKCIECNDPTKAKIRDRAFYKMFEKISEAFKESHTKGLNHVHRLIDSKRGYGSRTHSMYASESLELFLQDEQRNQENKS